MEEQKQTGDTQTIVVTAPHPIIRGHIDDTGHLHATVKDIHDEESYEEDETRFTFLIETYAGDMIELHLKEKHIQQLYLFVKKAQAEQRYYKHISK
jgi:hypothetical protein